MMSDRTADARDFDPRFDPAFQPGYDASNDPVALARGQSVYSAQYVTREPDARGAAPVVPTPVSSPTAEQGAAVAPSVRALPPEPDAFADAGRTPLSARNPFLIAIWVASAVFLLAGFALLRWLPIVSLQTQTSSSANYDYLVVQSVVIGAPLLIVLGLTTAVGSLFVYAARWRPRAAG